MIFDVIIPAFGGFLVGFLLMAVLAIEIQRERDEEHAARLKARTEEAHERGYLDARKAKDAQILKLQQRNDELVAHIHRLEGDEDD